MSDSAWLFVDHQKLFIVFSLSDEVVSVVLILEGNEGFSSEMRERE